MKKTIRESLRATLAATVTLSTLLSPAVAGQGPDIGELFGAIMNNALAQQNRQQWQSVSAFERDCLAAHHTTPAILAYHGIVIDDPRVQRAFAECARNASSPPDVAATPANSAPTGPYNSDFKVGGLTVGGVVAPYDTAYQAYTCRPSTDYPGFQWCGLHRQVKAVARPYDEYMTIFHSETYVVAFVLQDIIPAFFAPGDPEREIQRISKHFGQSPRIITGESRPDALHTVIATWGDVTLSPLDSENVEALRNGKTIHAGLLADFLGDSKISAREGMPIYRIGGGAGYIWSAKYDNAGIGRLRIVAVNTSLIPGTNPDRTPSDVPAYAPTQTPEPIQAPVSAPTAAHAAPAAAPTADASGYVGGGRDRWDVPSHASTPTPTPIPAPTPAVDPVQAERDRAARADKAVAAAKAQLEDVGTFIKEHPQTNNLLNYIDGLSALSVAIKTNDPDEIERKLTELTSELSHDKAYQQYADLVEAKKKHLAAEYLGDAIRRGQRQRDFLLGYIGNNPLSDVTPTFANYIKRLNPALQRSELDELQPLVDEVDLKIQEANLEAAFLIAKNQAPTIPQKGPGPTPSPSTNPSSLTPPIPDAEANSGLPVTEKNRFLLEGALEDVEILYNASASAPHIAQNLRGDFVFAQNQARVCLFGPNPDDVALIVKQAISIRTDPRQIATLVEPCSAEQLLAYDVVATERGAFLRSSKEDALSLIKAVERDDYRKWAEITAVDLSKAAEAERIAIEKIKTNVADGVPEGYGVVLLNTGSPTLCLALSKENASHKQLLLTYEGKLSLEMRSEVILKDTNIEDAFVSIQRRQCGAVYARAADLKSLTTALARTNTPFKFSSLWISLTDVERENAALSEKARIDAQQGTERAQRNADQYRLAERREKDRSAAQEAQQAALREKFGDSAKGAAGALASEITAWTKDQSGPLGGFFPAYAAWLADHWEIQPVNYDVQDFGTSVFKTRALETVFTKITLRLKHRMLGEYKDACFIFGRVNDAEFSMLREPVFAQCDDEAVIRAWQLGHQFNSEWFASN